MNGLIETLKSLGTTRLIVMGAITAALISFFVILSTRLSEPAMSLLFGELAIEDSAQIVAQLDQMGVPFEIRGGGAQIFVPDEQVLRLRLTMASEGLPAGGSVGYELFDKADGFGSSTFVQSINQVRALEGELSRTIRNIQGVAGVRVHLVMPRRQLFSRNRHKPSASIVVKMKGNSRLRERQVLAVQNLVASAVPELEPDGVTIIDTRGIMLSGRKTDASLGGLDVLEGQREAFELRMKQSVQSLIEQSVGVGNVRVQIAADIDFDQITINSESFDPDSQVARSLQTVEEISTSNEKDPSQVVSISENLPETAGGEPETTTAAEAGSSSSNRTRTEETINFEISKIIRTQVHRSGDIKRLSVAVLVNGKTTVAEDGTATYEPRSEEELKQLDTLVKSAIGFNAERGDRVEVVNMQFKSYEDVAMAGESEGLTVSLSKADYFRIGEILALLVVALLMVLLVLRPLLSRWLANGPATGTAQIPALGLPTAIAGLLPHLTKQQILDSPEVITAVEAGEISQDQLDNLIAAAPEAAEMPEEPEIGIDIDRIEGRVRASSLKKIGELVEKHPEEALSIMRQWMYSDT